MNDKKNHGKEHGIVFWFCLAISILFFMIILTELVYNYATIASITKQQQNMAIEISSLTLADELSSVPEYSVYVAATGHFKKIGHEKITTIDVVYLFPAYQLQAVVDIDHKKIIEVVRTQNV